MNRIIVHKELNDIIRAAEEKISEFHIVRKRIDGFRRVISALINKEVYQNCVDELHLASQELKGIFQVFLNFDKENKRYFVGSMKDYLNAYKSYLECAALASEKRLNIQRLILHEKTIKASNGGAKKIVAMMEEMEQLQNNCLNKAKNFNKIANMIKINKKKPVDF
jgi:hypothetical protein